MLVAAAAHRHRRRRAFANYNGPVPSPSKRMAAAFGETIGRYYLHSQIAEGGMARIHIARAVGSEGFSRLVAAKRLHPALAADREFVEMFLDEAVMASRIRHRNVVPVLDVVNVD